MARVRPVHYLILVPVFMAAVLTADFAFDGGFHRGAFSRVGPDASGIVRLEVGELASGDIRFFTFINPANQEVNFFVARDRHGTLQVAIDACEPCYKLRRGNRLDGEWIVCNKCDKAFPLVEINAGGGGCKPVPLPHRLEGEQLVLLESDIMIGWRYFR